MGWEEDLIVILGTLAACAILLESLWRVYRCLLCIYQKQRNLSMSFGSYYENKLILGTFESFSQCKLVKSHT